MAETVTHEHGATPDAPHEHEHPGVLEYVKIAIILAVVTAAEVGLYYVPEGLIGDGPTVAALVVMMVVKFVLVVAWFMHLRFDSPIFRRLFIAGIILAIAVYAVVLVQMSPSVGLPFR